MRLGIGDFRLRNIQVSKKNGAGKWLSRSLKCAAPVNIPTLVSKPRRGIFFPLFPVNGEGHRALTTDEPEASNPEVEIPWRASGGYSQGLLFLRHSSHCGSSRLHLRFWARHLTHACLASTAWLWPGAPESDISAMELERERDEEKCSATH
jgi:hypothetical protein